MTVANLHTVTTGEITVGGKRYYVLQPLTIRGDITVETLTKALEIALYEGRARLAE